jgi:hypothetical protein
MIMCLRFRPISESCIFILALARLDGVADAEGSIATSVAAVLEDLPGHGLPHEILAEIAVEAFVTLAKIDRSRLLESAARPLRYFDGFEQTRLLDAVVSAMRANSGAGMPAFTLSVIKDRWESTVSADGSRFADRPGVAARLLELIGRSGTGFESALAMMRSSNSESSINSSNARSISWNSKLVICMAECGTYKA